MKKLLSAAIGLVLMFLQWPVVAQVSTAIKGQVLDKTTGNALPAVSVVVAAYKEGTITDAQGNFSLSTRQAFPLTIIFTAIGYDSLQVLLPEAPANWVIQLNAVSALGQNVVVGASRTRQNILNAPVSVEQMSRAAIVHATNPNFYDGIWNLKGTDLTTSSLTFKTVSTRGFNGSGNLRFNQFIDGMDNQAPGLSFSVGNIIGITELDADNVELLPGASSALYGSGGMNGTLLMNSKNPFQHQGLSVQYKQGFNHINDYRHPVAPLFDGEIRYAKAFKEKFAFKIAAKYFTAEDWHADDSTDLLRNNINSTVKPGGTRSNDINYDGVNLFGDEASAGMQPFANLIRELYRPVATGIVDPRLPGRTPQEIAQEFPQYAPLLPFLIPTSPNATAEQRNLYNTQLVSRTGYYEKDLVDYNAYNYKITGGLYYKINRNVEASAQAYFGSGTTVYTGSDRYVLKNLQVGQYKLEVRSNNWFLRGYTTQENSGDSYTATTAAVAVNSAWKPNSNWFQEYIATYGAARLGLLPGVPTPLPDAQAHAIARGQADNVRALPGSAAFQNAFNKAVSTPISQGGAKFTDKTSLYHFEGQYNFSNLVKAVDILAGANYRVFHLNSGGTIFADTAGPINIREYGAYLQLQKKLFKEVLKLTASGRYDKNQNFKGRFTPRFSALIGVAKNNNIRFSYQIAYRFPSTQDQYINLQTPAARLIGGLPEFESFYRFQSSPACTAESILEYRRTLNPEILREAPFGTLKPESVNSWELGYRGLVTKRLLVDVYGYTTRYSNFIGRIAVGRGQSADPARRLQELLSPLTTTNYSFAVNSSSAINSLGWGGSVEYLLFDRKEYRLMANVSGDQLRNVPAGFISFFNTPRVRYNIGLSNPDAYRHFGFNMVYRWQDKVNWEGTFGSGQIPAYGTLDAHISYTLPTIGSLIKLGGTNVLNRYYRSAFGNPYIGGLYYLSVGYNVTNTAGKQKRKG